MDSPFKFYSRSPMGGSSGILDRAAARSSTLKTNIMLEQSMMLSGSSIVSVGKADKRPLIMEFMPVVSGHRELVSLVWYRYMVTRPPAPSRCLSQCRQPNQVQLCLNHKVSTQTGSNVVLCPMSCHVDKEEGCVLL